MRYLRGGVDVMTTPLYARVAPTPPTLRWQGPPDPASNVKLVALKLVTSCYFFELFFEFNLVEFDDVTDP